MYPWLVYLHVTVIFIFLIQHAYEILVTYRLRNQTDPEGVEATYAFLPNHNTRNLRITYVLIIITGSAGCGRRWSSWSRSGWSCGGPEAGI